MTASTASPPRNRMTRSLLYAGGLAVVWLLAAAWRPDMTYHLAPLLVAGTPPVIVAFDRPQAPSWGTVAMAGIVGFAGAVAAAGVLLAAGWLEGPALELFPNVLVESIVAAAIGAVGGFGAARLRRP